MYIDKFCILYLYLTYRRKENQVRGRRKESQVRGKEAVSQVICEFIVWLFRTHPLLQQQHS
jgi:hypothetical protein